MIDYGTKRKRSFLIARVSALLVFCWTVILAACSPSAGSYNSSGQAALDAQATLNAVELQTTSIAHRTLEAYQNTQVAGAATAGAAEAQITLIAVQIQGTAAALDAEVTRTLTHLEVVNAQSTLTQSVKDREATTTAQSNATATAVPLTATAVKATLNAEDREREMQEWSDFLSLIWIPIRAVLLLIAAVLLLMAAVWTFRNVAPVLVTRLGIVQRGEHDAPFMIVRYGGRLLAMDLDRAFGPVIDVTPKGPVMIAGTAEDPADQRARNWQDSLVDVARGLNNGKGGRGSAPSIKMLQDLAQPKIPAQIADPSSPPPAPAAWSLLANHEGHNPPLGVDASGRLLAPDLDQNPHRLFAGKTSAGKSRLGMRPLVAFCLAKGWLVVTLGDQHPNDLRIFDGHPNFHLAVVDDPKMLLGYLSAITREVSRRQELLYQHNVPTWAGLLHEGPRVLVVFDEFAALVDAFGRKDREEFNDQMANLSRLARKAGIHLALGAQNPTRESVRPSIRRNMLMVSFRMTDQRASMAVLGVAGAELLRPPQFLIVQDGEVIRGRAFAPEDHDINALLTAGHDQPIPRPAFLDASSSPAPVLPRPASNSAARETRILQMWDDGATVPEIEEAVFGYHGGYAFRFINRTLGDRLNPTPVEILTTTTTPLDAPADSRNE